jgi:hypothetical protein
VGGCSRGGEEEMKKRKKFIIKYKSKGKRPWRKEPSAGSPFQYDIWVHYKKYNTSPYHQPWWEFSRQRSEARAFTYKVAKQIVNNIGEELNITAVIEEVTACQQRKKKKKKKS